MAIDNYKTEIDTHPASPIRPKKDISSQSGSQAQILQLPSLPKPEPVKVDSSRKGSTSSVHFNSYMKSTRTVSEKVKLAIEKEKIKKE